MAFTLSGNGRVNKYSKRERALFTLLPRGGQRVDTNRLIAGLYKKDPPLHARASIVGGMKSLMRKVERNKERFRICQSERSGPHPSEFWLERSRKTRA